MRDIYSELINIYLRRSPTFYLMFESINFYSRIVYFLGEIIYVFLILSVGLSCEKQATPNLREIAIVLKSFLG
jgi:hypothetical protein